MRFLRLIFFKNPNIITQFPAKLTKNSMLKKAIPKKEKL
jgi:hypothetical protein